MKSPKVNYIEKADRRIWEIDFVRGILIIGMIIDHFMFFLGMFGTLYPVGALPDFLNRTSEFATAYWNNELKTAIRIFGVSLFFLLTGISSKFSKSNLKRSVICMGFGILMALGYMIYSFATGTSNFVLFNIITCLGLGMFLLWGAKALYVKIRKSDKNWCWWALGIGLFLIIVGFVVNLIVSTHLLFGRIYLSMHGQYAPGEFNSHEPLTFGTAVLTILGFHHWGNDWCGICPFIGYTFLGGFIGEFIYSNRKSIFFRKNEEKNVSFNRTAIKKTWFINWLGSKTFIIYIIHPVVIILLLLIVYSISAGQLPF